MQDDTDTDLETALLAELARGRKLLLDADFAGFGALAEDLDRMTRRLADTPRAVGREALARIARAAQENQKLLAAGRQGFVSAQDRKHVILGGATLKTYDRNGAHDLLAPAANMLERRA